MGIYSVLLENSNNKLLYHLSINNLNGKYLEPRIPDNYFIKNGYEDNETKRVCLSKSIQGSLMGLGYNCKGKEFYVNIPDGIYKTYTPSKSEVPDCKITKEIWILEKVKLKCIGKIKVIKDAGEDGIKFSYGEHNHSELYKCDWEWLEKYN